MKCVYRNPPSRGEKCLTENRSMTKIRVRILHLLFLWNSFHPCKIPTAHDALSYHFQPSLAGLARLMRSYEPVKGETSLRSGRIPPSRAGPLPHECNFKIYRNYMRGEMQLKASHSTTHIKSPLNDPFRRPKIYKI